METNKIDTEIKKKLADRTFTPSNSAWERLSVQLDEQPKQQKTKWFLYVSVAASIVLLLTIGIQFFSVDNETIFPQEELVIDKKDKEILEEKIDQFINEIPAEEAIVKEEKSTPKQVEKKIAKNEVTFEKPRVDKIKQDQLIVAKVDENIPQKSNDDLLKEASLERIEKMQTNTKSGIKINADALLFAVTHTPKEAKAYYAKYKIDRNDALQTIKTELKKSELNVNPEAILAEVERSIEEDDFQNNFLNTLKRRVTDIASAIASRND